MNNLIGKVSNLYEQDYFVLAGITPDYLVEKTKTMLQDMMDENIKIILDTNPEIMRDLVSKNPFLYKTTPRELSKIVEKNLSTRDDVIQAAQQLHHNGVKHVLVVMENETAILVCEQGTYACELLQEGHAVDTVGTGDSLVAGFLMDYLRTRDPIDSFKFGASCGAATAYSKGLATREKIDQQYSNTKIEKIN